MKLFFEYVFGFTIVAGVTILGFNFIGLQETHKDIVSGRVYVDGSAYYCTMGEMSKKRLELLKQAEKLRE